jgi:hypothetical protein
LHPAWQLPRDVVLFLLVMELLASYDGRDRAPRSLSSPRGRDAHSPRRVVHTARGSLSGRRPRG